MASPPMVQIRDRSPSRIERGVSYNYLFLLLFMRLFLPKPNSRQHRIFAARILAAADWTRLLIKMPSIELEKALATCGLEIVALPSNPVACVRSEYNR
jgi:hypothetical protein